MMNKQKQQLVIGVAIVLCIAISHVIVSQLIYRISVKHGFKSQLFLQTINSSFSAIYLIVCGLLRPSIQDPVRLYIMSLLFYWIQFLCNFSYVKSLNFIAPSIAGCMMASTPVYVFLFSLCLLPFQYSHYKLAATVIAISANTLIIVSKMETDFRSLVGLILVIIASILSAFYQVVFKRVNMKSGVNIDGWKLVYFLGCIGLNSLIFQSIELGIVNYYGIEEIEWKVVRQEVGLFIGMMICSLVFQSLISFGLIFTEPLFISIGILLDLPINIVVDWLINRLDVSLAQIVGSLMVVVSFVMIVYGRHIETGLQDKLVLDLQTDHDQQ